MLRLFWFFLFLDFPRYVLTDVFMALTALYYRIHTPRRRREFLTKLETSPPLVSVVIPALNEENTIYWTVRSLKEQTYKNLEIIVVDDGSTDRTQEICRELARAGEIRYFRFEDRSGKSAALNYGVEQASGEFIVFVDSDTTFDRLSIFNLIKYFDDPRVGAVSGNILVRNSSAGLLTALQSIEYTFSISIGRRFRALVGILPVISGAFGGFRSSLVGLKVLGGHEPGPGNDSDLTLRVRKAGFNVAFAHDAFCYTNVPETFPSLIKQRWRWDRNLVKNRLRKHRDVFNPFTKNFLLRNALSSLDSITFHIGLATLTVVYMVDILVHYPRLLLFVLLVNYFVYVAAELIQFAMGIFLTGIRSNLKLLLYVPLYHPYKMVLKLFRLVGYFQELALKWSYRDPFAPYKVRERMMRW